MTANQEHQYGNPIPGHFEVAATKYPSSTEKWQAYDGIFFEDRNY
jgi:hypothetical protein